MHSFSSKKFILGVNGKRTPPAFSDHFKAHLPFDKAPRNQIIVRSLASGVFAFWLSQSQGLAGRVKTSLIRQVS